jgi:hypothetical protein
MRYGACLLIALLTGACSIYDTSVGGGSSGGAGDSTTAGDPTSAGAGGEGGTDIGTSAGGAPSGTSGAAGEGGSGTSVTGPGTTGGLAGRGGSAGTAGAGAGVGGAGGSSAAGGSAGKSGAAGSGSGSGGSSGNGGSGGSQTMPDAGTGPDSGVVCAPGTCKRVFLSLSSPAPSGKLGGVAAVDTFCQMAADAKRLGGTWRAWISDTTTSPSTRFTRATVPYRLLDGSAIAANWTVLAGGTLQHAINIHEDGTSPPPAAVYEVWTGTNPNGTYSGHACANWTNDTNMAPTGDVGVTSVANSGWTNIYQQFCDRTTNHVYCFEQ